MSLILDVKSVASAIDPGLFIHLLTDICLMNCYDKYVKKKCFYLAEEILNKLRGFIKIFNYLVLQYFHMKNFKFFEKGGGNLFIFFFGLFY